MKPDIHNNSSLAPSQDDIAQRAQKLWDHYGRPEDRDQEIWLEAERQLLGVDPLIEGKDDVGVSASQFDSATGQGKKRMRA